MFKLLLGSVAIALAGSSSPAPLPSKLPVDFAGFAFGDSLAEVEKRCLALGPAKNRRRFASILDRGAACREVRPARGHLPPVVDLTMMIEDDAVVSFVISARLPMLMEHARQIARSPDAQVEGQKYCRGFSDNVGMVCIALHDRLMMFTLVRD